MSDWGGPRGETLAVGKGLGQDTGDGRAAPAGYGRGAAAAIDVRAAKRRYRWSVTALVLTIAGCIYGFLVDDSVRPDPFRICSPGPVRSDARCMVLVDQRTATPGIAEDHGRSVVDQFGFVVATGARGRQR